MAETRREQKRHNLTIENRERLTATGILRVDSFSEELITAQTDLGQLNIKGEGLHIEKLNSDTGDMYVIGKVIALSYSQASPSASFLSRLFK